MRLATLLLICCGFLCWNPSADAFSEGGHKLTASIAFRRLTPEQRKKVIDVLKHHPRFQQDFKLKMPEDVRDGSEEDQHEWIFQQAAIWPDLARGTPFHRGSWHFINRPLFLRPEDEHELEETIDVNLNVEPPSTDIDARHMNVVQAIVNSSRVLESDDQPKATKAVHLCWLLHLIGDLHQPLHSSALFSQHLFPQGDKGGNGLKTTVHKNLHAVWDRTFGTETSLEDARDLATDLLEREDLQLHAHEASSQLSPVSMWDESFAMATNHAYSREVLNLLRDLEENGGNLDDAPVALSPEYGDTRRKTCEVAVVRAGARMASYLIALTTESADATVPLAEVHRLDPARLGRRTTELGRQIASLTRELNASRDVERRSPSDVPRRSDYHMPVPRVPAADEPAVTTNTTARFPSFDPMFPPPEGTKAFELSQNYPHTYDTTEVFPWSEIDYRTNSIGYLKAVLSYCLEGNVEVDFRGQENETRTWYHAPWMHDDGVTELPRRAGREYHHGLTSERRARPFELHPLQTGEGFPEKRIQNWAVSLYSPRGGFTLGKIWDTASGDPDPYQATFPDNTVSFKLLFSAAPIEQVPFLKDSFEWTANINPLDSLTPFRRVDQTVRLLQVDVAVKDPRVADATGWIFGTFVYDGSRLGDTSFDRLVPVGLSWGDDAHEKRHLEKQGSFVNPHLRSTVINHELLEPANNPNWQGKAYVRHHGLGGRLNGPVDNQSSSCISCHGRAGVAHAQHGLTMPIVHKSGSVAEQIVAFDEFFRLIRPNRQLVRGKASNGTDTDFITLDYSLQVSMGIRNYHQSKLTSGPGAASDALRPAPALPRISRDEAEKKAK